MITPYERMVRMRKSFDKDKSVLITDYKYFTTPDVLAKRHVPTPQSKAARMSAERSGRRSRAQNGTQSSDKTDD